MVRDVLEVEYGQIAVFDARLPRPFNNWTNSHVCQGFSWRPGSVSFATVDAAGSIFVSIDDTSSECPGESAAERIIVVPFSVPDHGEVDVATTVGALRVHLLTGEYELIFEHGRRSDADMWAHFRFRCVVRPVLARIVRASTGLSPEGPLVMIAEPA